MSKIGIVGTVHLTQRQEELAKMICMGILGHWQVIEENPTFVSGGAKGIDSIGEQVADEYCLPKEIKLPEYRDWEDLDLGPGKVMVKGFKSRNIEIAETASPLYCISVGRMVRNFPQRPFPMLEFDWKGLDQERVEEIWNGGVWTAWYAETQMKKPVYRIVIS